MEDYKGYFISVSAVPMYSTGRTSEARAFVRHHTVGGQHGIFGRPETNFEENRLAIRCSFDRDVAGLLYETFRPYLRRNA